MLDMVLNSFHYNNRVIDNKTDGENKSHESDRIDIKTDKREQLAKAIEVSKETIKIADGPEIVDDVAFLYIQQQ